MSTQPADRVDLDIIEALDFHHEPACESRVHEIETEIHAGHAYALLRSVAVCCGATITEYRCRPFVKYALGGGWFRCRECTEVTLLTVTILGYVGGSS